MNKEQVNLLGIFNKRSRASQSDFKRYELMKGVTHEISLSIFECFSKSATKVKFKSSSQAEMREV